MEIGPYRRPSQRYLALAKIIRDATPIKSSFPSTDGASQVKGCERAADICPVFAPAPSPQKSRVVKGGALIAG